MKILKKVALLGLFFYLPFSCMAWGLLGHRIVGQIAESYLTPKAKKEIQNILGVESLAMASNWADFIRSDSSFNFLAPWHYINVEDNLTYKDLQAYLKTDTIADAYTKINFLVKELRNKQLAKDKKILYLRLLIHIVGDVHQPMHVSREEDLGGNKIKVIWFNEPSNLHRVWDEQLIDAQKLSYTEYTAAINHTKKAQVTTWQKQPVSKWLFDSYVISQQLYAEIKQPDPRLSYRYNFDHIQTVNDQLVKGGVHLAGLLNEIFG